MKNEPITIVVADDHDLMREGLKLILQKEQDIDIKGIAYNGKELVDLVQEHQPDVVLTDIVMPLMDGIEATKCIKRKFPKTEIIALSMFDDQSLVLDMVKAGVIGYLLKNSDKNEIISAIHSASRHESYYDKTISVKLARYASQLKVQKPTPLFFTEKELQVIRYICMEFNNKEISKEMYVSERTIEGYRSKLLQKMNVKSMVGIVIYALQHNLFTLDAISTSEDD